MRSTLQRFALSLLLLAAPGCGYYDGPPRPSIDGAEDGVLDDPKAPIVLRFSEPVVPSSLHVTIARYVTDVEGNLPNEDADPNTELDVLFEYQQNFPPTGGTAELVDDDTVLRIMPTAAMPIGPKLVLLVEPGLSDRLGHTTKTRKRVLFAYRFDLKCDKPTAVFRPGYYFLLADIKNPIQTQVQLFGSLDLDASTGKIRGQFTNADRNMEKGRCPFDCPEACRTLPMPACVAPSERAGTVDEFPDYIPNAAPPAGYTFTADGCVADQPGGSTVFVTAPVDVIVQIPPVTLRNAALTAELSPDAEGVLRGSGSLVADEVLLGTSASGKGEAALVLRSITDMQAPPGIPAPPASSP
jgi:hypothetical protein